MAASPFPYWLCPSYSCSQLQRDCLWTARNTLLRVTPSSLRTNSLAGTTGIIKSQQHAHRLLTQKLVTLGVQEVGGEVVQVGSSVTACMNIPTAGIGVAMAPLWVALFDDEPSTVTVAVTVHVCSARYCSCNCNSNSNRTGSCAESR